MQSTFHLIHTLYTITSCDTFLKVMPHVNPLYDLIQISWYFSSLILGLGHLGHVDKEVFLHAKYLKV